MSILSKVTLGFVIIAALGFWYLGMRALKTHQAWRSAVAAHELAIDTAKTKTQTTMGGDPEKKGSVSMGQLQVALDSALYGRGRTWVDTLPRFDAATGNLLVSVEQPQPHQIEANMVLNAFQGLDDPTTGSYVGEFKVAAADGNNVTLTPTYTPTADRQARLQRAVGPWTLYEVLPSDMNELFAGLPEDAVRDLLPDPPKRLPGETNDDFQARQVEHSALLSEYLEDNKPIDANDPPPPERIQVVVKFVKDEKDLTEAAKADLRAIDFGENLVKSGVTMKVDLPTAAELVRLGLVQEVERRYQRKLRDYGYVLSEYHRRMPILEDQIANLESDLDYIIEANQEADKHLAEAKMQDDRLNEELALVSKESGVVGQFQSTLQERLEKLNAQIAQLQEENQRLAAQLAQRQLEAVRGAGRAAAATALATPR